MCQIHNISWKFLFFSLALHHIHQQGSASGIVLVISSPPISPPALGDTGRVLGFLLSSTSLRLVPLSSEPLSQLESCRPLLPRLSCLLYVPPLVMVSEDDVKAGLTIFLRSSLHLQKLEP